jgi:hypothetical protein
LLLASNVEQVRATPVYLFGRYNLTEDFVPAQGYTLVVCYTHKPAEGDTESRIGVWAGGSSNRVADLERNVEQSVQVVKFTKAAANALPRELRFYYAPSPGNHAGQATIHWAALYLGDVVPAMQWQPNLTELREETFANSSAIQGLTSIVTQQGSSISSQGRDLTALQNTVNDPKTGLAATAGALNETNSRVTSVEGQQEALATSQLVLNAEMKRQQAGEDADLERVLNQFDTQKEQTQIRASLAEFKNVQADENRALAESITTLETGIGINSAAVEQVARSLTELDGKIASSWGVKLQANQSGVKYVSGVGLDLTNESGVMQSTFAVLADRFAVMHAANGMPMTVFSVQGGASIFNTALIGDTTIGFAKIMNDIQSFNYVPNASGWRLDKGGTFQLNGNSAQGRTEIRPNFLGGWYANGNASFRIGEW